MEVDLSKYSNINLNNFSMSANSSDDVIETDDSEHTEKDIFCLRCGRKLKGYDSRKIGIGPSCLQHMIESKNKPINLLDIAIK